jgi:ATP-dependent Clp protease ATP-binding subunit ClpA
MTTADLYLAIMAETNSHAHYFFLKYGATKQEFVTFWERHYNHTGHKITDQQATEILEEHCVNLTDLARKDSLEPMIGRDSEVEEMITVLARRFKANVLMVGDAGVGIGVVAGGVDVNEGQLRPGAMASAVAALEEAHLPQTEGAAAVEKDGEGSG